MPYVWSFHEGKEDTAKSDLEKVLWRKIPSWTYMDQRLLKCKHS